jgi:hypothetical protein
MADGRIDEEASEQEEESRRDRQAASHHGGPALRPFDQNGVVSTLTLGRGPDGVKPNLGLKPGATTTTTTSGRRPTRPASS